MRRHSNVRPADPALQRQLIDFFRWNVDEMQPLWPARPAPQMTVVEKICRRCLSTFVRHYRDPASAASAHNLKYCEHCLRW
jgi:hypothetical protein